MKRFSKLSAACTVLCASWIGLTAAAQDDCLFLEMDQFVAGKDTTWRLSQGVPKRRGIIVYGANPGLSIVNGIYGWCATFGISGIGPNRVICIKRFNGFGEINCKKKIASNMKGQTYYFQGAMHRTCPDECMSNLIEAVAE